MPMFHYVSGVYCYLYFDQMHANLIWYLYPFMLNKICLSLSLSLRTYNHLALPAKHSCEPFPSYKCYDCYKNATQFHNS